MSSGMPVGTAVLYCSHCKQATVEGSGKWVPVGPGFRESLVLLAGTVKQETDARDAVMTSDIRDPRWEVISEFM